MQLASQGTETLSSERTHYVLRRLMRSPTFIIGVGITMFWLISAVAWPLFAPHNPLVVNTANTLQGPSAAHWFGTDDLGRDVLSRVLAGARPVFIVAPAATALSLAGGTMLGLFSGYYRGLADDVTMRIVDVLMSLPLIVTAVVILALLGSSTINVILVIAVLFIPLVSRTVRSAVLTERDKEYVLAARLNGENPFAIMLRDILPNVLTPIVVEGGVRLGFAVFTAATLSFLGLGLQPPSPDWGLTVSLERTFVQIAPWTVLFPAAALASLVIGVNLAADGLRRGLQA